MSAVDIKANAAALLPEIRARREEIEQARRLPRDLSDRMAAAGLYRLVIPKDVGGLECEPWTVIEVIEMVAEADASAGWCTMISATSCIKSAFMAPHVAQRLYGDPLAVHGGVFAPMGTADIDGDDYIVNGTWQWASGSANCTWLTGGCVIRENGEARKLESGAVETRQLVFPAEAAELPDDWHVAGLRGTGSGSMKIADLRVPQEQSISLASDQPQMGGPLYAFPSFGMLALGVAAAALGNAQGALNDLTELAAGKTPQGGRRTLAQRATAQAELAKATAALRSARAYMKDAVEKAWQEAQAGGRIGPEGRLDLRLSATNAARQSAEVCRAMYDLGGGSSLFLASPLQRRVRDSLGATQHMMVAPATYELTGRILMGLDTDLTFL